MRLAILALVLAACAHYQPPPPAPERAPTPVAAPFDRTWDAVVDFYAAKNIRIRTMEKASGYVTGDPLVRLETMGSQMLRLADCGQQAGVQFPPSSATYNVRVRGDSARSTVQVTVLWQMTNGQACATRGVWEREFEEGVKAKAEGSP